jgi:GDPmannose 4,6-dehydratase
VGNINKIQADLNWQPKYSFQQLVELMVDYDMQKLKAAK